MEAGLLDDFEIVTLEDITREIEGIERQLAQKHNIYGQVRRELIRRIASNQIVEDLLVSKWHGLYSVILDCARERLESSYAARPKEEKGAAAGRPFFCPITCMTFCDVS